MFTKLRYFPPTILLIVGVTLVSQALTGDVIRTLPAPAFGSTGMAWDGKNLWVADIKTDSLYALDPVTGRVTASLPSPAFKTMGLAWDGQQLWCVCGEEGKIYRLRPQDGVATRVFDAPATNPTGMAWDGRHLWLAARSPNAQIHQISPLDGTTIHSLPAPSRNPQGLTFEGRYLWLSDRLSNRLYMISPDQGDVIVMFDAPGPYADGLAWDGKNLWNADFQTDSLYCLAVGDEGNFRCKDVKTERIELTTVVRNFGPGSVETIDAYLAIPQNLANQKLLDSPVFSPPPVDFLTDQWGQKVAHFHLGPCAAGTVSRVGLTVQAQVWDTRWYIFPEKVGKLETIPREVKELYLADDEKFDQKNPIIQKAVKEAVGDEKNPYWIMRKIFRYILAHMEYELSGGWNTAPAVLERGNGSCSEYTFVFLSMCRAAGLPARYAGSVVIRGDDACIDDVFHRWAEVYLPNYGWIPVDPSGGDSPSPEAQADFIGHVANRYLITTLGGGNSQYLTWNYNADQSWTTKGQCKVTVENLAEWNPVKPGEAAVIPAEKLGGKVCEP
jgi:sugar lactone lactonase YvrE